MHLIRHPELFEIKTISEVLGVATKCKFSQTVVKKMKVLPAACLDSPSTS